MDVSRGTPNGPLGSPGRRLIKDIVLECDGSDDGDRDTARPTEIRILQPGNVEEGGTSFPLRGMSLERWEVEGVIELARTVEEVKCVVKDGSGVDIGFVRLACVPPGGPDNRLSRPVESLGEHTRLLISWSWEIVETASTPAKPSDVPSSVDRIAFSIVLYDRFESTDHLPYLSAAIILLQRAVDSMVESDGNLCIAMSNLGNYFQSRFERAGDVHDLHESIAVHRRAVQLAPDGDTDLPAYLCSLANGLHSRFNVGGDHSDISEAIAIQRRALSQTPEGHAYLAARLNNFGQSLACRFRSAGNLDDIAEAISVQHRAVGLTPEGHPHLPTILEGVGNSFLCRFNRTGDLGDLAEGILAQRKAVHLTPEGHIALPSHLQCLGNSLRSRFERTGIPDDIDEAISSQRRAVELTPEGHGKLSLRLSSLGLSLESRYRHIGDMDYLNEAIIVQRKVVRLTPDDRMNLPVHLNGLGTSLTLRFHSLRVLQDIDEAITVQEKALALTSKGRAELPSQYTNLGNSFLSRFRQTGDGNDVSRALSAHQKAVELIPEGHAYLPLCLINLANSWHGRAVSNGHAEDMDTCIVSYRAAATCAYGSPRIRASAAIRWARLVDEHRPDSSEVLSAYDIAIRTVCVMAGLEQTIQSRYAVLQRYSGLSLEAATVALRLQRPQKALEWLEHGRCLVWGQQRQLRTPLDELALLDSGLAGQVKDTARRLEHAGSSFRDSRKDVHPSERVSLEDEARSHVALAKEWEDLLAKARAIPGLETFLQPLSFSNLGGNLPASGSVIVINVHANRCDAIALLAGLDEPRHVPLPMFSWEKADRYRQRLTVLLQSRGMRLRGDSPLTDEDEEATQARALELPRRKGVTNHDGLRSVLRSLWVEVVKPLLDAFGISKFDPSSSTIAPRIWWCPTGPLSFLPLHAAGIYTGPERESLMDYAISSYTPTVTSLTKRATTDGQIDDAVSGLLLTSQPSPPGASAISGTTKEVTSIYDEGTGRGARCLKLSGEDLDPQNCLKYMEGFSSIHLACHASQNAADPLRSRFLFHNGQLDLSTIIAKNLKNADLAFLSACQTSTGEETLADEAVHLAAGMLAAGYRRVVATMWAIDDKQAPQVAHDFYRYLWTHQEGSHGAQFDATLSAYALHHAIWKLRERLHDSDSSLLAWIPYVHFGY